MILGIDQGTTGTTAVLLSEEGKIIGSSTAAVPQHFPQPGWVEHDPEEIWKSLKSAVAGVLQKTNTPSSKISRIGITNQRETVTVFENENPLHRFIVWQDRRTTDDCRKLEKKYAKDVRKKSGLPIDPYFSASKVSWLQKKLKLSAKNKAIRFRTIESFLIHKMTGADVTEATNASRTSLMDLKKVEWNESLFDIFSVPRAWTPEIISSEGFRFKTKRLDFLPDGIPIVASLGDQQAALFGQMGWKPGAGKITFGTGSFILLNTGASPILSKNALVSTLALQWSNRKNLYALEGSVFICGAWIQWLRDELKMISSSDQSEALAKEVKSSEGIFVIPALSGLGAPFWRPEARGAILGLTRGSSRAHIALASLEALAFQNRALIDAMKSDLTSLRSTSWKVDGGAVKNNLLMQIQADVLKTPILRPKNLEATATGVARLAGVSTKLFSLEEVEKLWEKDKEFEVSANAKYYSSLYDQWKKQVTLIA